MGSKWLANQLENYRNFQFQNAVIDKLKAITGSNYEYEKATGIVNENYDKIGEAFGLPIYQDAGRQYETEYLEFPTLGDLIDSWLNRGITITTSFSKCSACITISFSIGILTYPPQTYCVTTLDCKKDPPKPEPPIGCKTQQEIDNLTTYLNNGLDNLDAGTWNEYSLPAPAFEKPLCESLPEFPTLPPTSEEDFIDVYVWSQRWTKGIVFIKKEGSNWEPKWVSYPPSESHDHKPLIFDHWIGMTREEYESGELKYPRWPTNFNWRNSVSSQYFFKIFLQYGYDRWRTLDSINLSGGGYLNTEIKIEINGIPYTPFPQIENPLPHPVIPMSNCCDDSLELLAALTKKINKIYKVINPEQFEKKEIQVPRSWIYPGHDPTPEVAEDLPDVMAMILRMIDRRIGFMPQVIHLKDANPALDGDQGKSLIVNSLSDLCKHIFEFQVAAGREESKVNKALLKVGGATMFETGATHQLAIVMERMLVAITEYLDFEATQKKETFKMYFNPTKQLGKSNLEQHLNGMIGEHNQPIEVMEWKGGSSEKDKLNEIIKKVSLCAAALSTTKPLDQIVKEAKDLARAERLLIIKEMQDREGISDLKEFNDDAEKGYPSSNQSKEIKKHPYGFSSGEPKFRRTTNKSKKRKYTNKAKGKR